MTLSKTEEKEAISRGLVQAFDGVLKCFVDAKTYHDRPPKGPPTDLPTLTDDELRALKQTTHGEDLARTGYAYHEIALVEDPKPVHLVLPAPEELRELNICGIDGSSQRIERSSFYFILARASIIEFRYSTIGSKPYFYQKSINGTAVTWVDGNVFDDTISLHTKALSSGGSGEADILRYLGGVEELPLLVRYDPDKVDKSPSSHALGWAVKLQQALELLSLKQVPTTLDTVCIKDGPLFSTSVSQNDTIEGLNPIFTWDRQVLVACSKRIKDSTLLVEALTRNVDLRKYWFPDQEISDATLRSIATDSILLPRILRPGYRTPLMLAVPVARRAIVDAEPRLTPLSCYYLSRHQPHTYIRVEVPRFMWEQNKKRVEDAIRMVAWQHELGHSAPLVQMVADQRCQLQYEKDVLEKQTIARLHRNKLDFPTDY